MRSMQNRALWALIVTLLVGFGLATSTSVAMAQEKGSDEECVGEDCDLPCYPTMDHYDHLNSRIDLLGAMQKTKAPKGRMHGLSSSQYQLTPWAGLHWGVGPEVLGNLNIYGKSGDLAVPLRLAAFFRAIEPTSHLGLELKGLIGGQFANDRNNGDTVYPFNTALRVSAMAAWKHWGLKFGTEVMFQQGPNVGSADELTTLLNLEVEYRVNHFYIGPIFSWSVYSERGAHDGPWIGLGLGYTSQKN